MKKFDYETTKETLDGIQVQLIKVQGYLDSSTFDQLQDHLQNLIDENQFRIVVDFGNLDYISSAGLGVLVGMQKEARRNQGDIKLSNMAPKVRNLFDMLGFSRLLRIYPNSNDALQAFVKDQEERAEPHETTLPEDDY